MEEYLLWLVGKYVEEVGLWYIIMLLANDHDCLGSYDVFSHTYRTALTDPPGRVKDVMLYTMVKYRLSTTSTCTT